MKKNIIVIAALLLCGIQPLRAATKDLAPKAAGSDAPVKAERSRIVDCGSDYLRDGDGRPNHQFHVHRWGLVKDEATGLWNVSKRVETDLTVDVDGDGKTDDDAVAYHEFSLTRPFSPDAPWYDSLAGSPRWYGGKWAPEVIEENGQFYVAGYGNGIWLAKMKWLTKTDEEIEQWRQTEYAKLEAERAKHRPAEAGK